MKPVARRRSHYRGGQAALARLTGWLLRLLSCTLRPVYVHEDELQRVLATGEPIRLYEDRLQRVLATGKPVLVAFWHGRLLFFVYLWTFYRSLSLTVLVSRSRDGEFLSKVLRCFGGRTTRGSSSQGNVRALLEIIRCVRQGTTVAFTPDGPRGPRYCVQPGIIAVAKHTGTPIVPLTYSAQWKKVLESWDRFVIPLPFSRVVVVFGDAITVPGDASAAVCEAKRQEVEASLARLTACADAYCAPYGAQGRR